MIARCEAASKKRLIETLGGLLAEGDDGFSPTVVSELLRERERLGSTGLGRGVALPHARMQGLNAPVAAFVQLHQAIDFDAIDDRPVDLAFGLLVPDATNEQHLQLLASLAAAFDDDAFRKALRAAEDAPRLTDILRDRLLAPS